MAIIKEDLKTYNKSIDRSNGAKHTLRDFWMMAKCSSYYDFSPKKISKIREAAKEGDMFDLIDEIDRELPILMEEHHKESERIQKKRQRIS